ncbi:putative glucan 1,3-beta-glucosidase A [Camellia lanceoleosa]|uniref:Glucan 1,3-beta-glucosidase A n=1 Tax=Camellia lanceoleosa TaxID=1840588 RepID=A0ACC0HLK7_9ERIC|nr:putative glucan 1,3-beta-glucosidase A [Camellia lanceoleosa]
MLSLSNGRLTPNFKIRAVNLGGWLVTEKWIKPSLFDGIPNKDFLDGTGLQFKSVTAGKYLCAETWGGSIIVANRTVASGWETFKEHWNTFIVEDDFNFISSNGINAVRILRRYAKYPRLYAVELINEPLSPGATLESLNKYYRAGYNVVRKYSSTAYVIMSNRIATSDPKEFFSLAKLNQLTTSNGPLTFIGEWVAEWNVEGATKEDYQKFANAQLDVYGKASFGWAYWTLKNVNNHWSLEWMINNHYIKL